MTGPAPPRDHPPSSTTPGGPRPSLVRPSPQVTRAVDRRRARTLAAAMLTLGSLGLVADIIGPMVLNGAFLANAAARHGAISSVLALAAYGLARTPYWRHGAVIGVAAVLYGTWANILLADGDPAMTASVFFLALPMVLAGALLDRGTTVVVGAINVIAIATVPGLFPTDPVVGRSIAIIFLVLLTALIVVLASIWRGDVAEIDHQRRDLADREARLDAILNNAPVYLLLIDSRGVIQYCNQVLPGLTQEQVVGSIATSWLQEPAGTALARAIENALAGIPSDALEFEGPGPNGTAGWWSARVVPVGGALASESRALIVAQDITERKAAEADRIKNAAHEAEIAQLRQLTGFKTQFINMAAHELSTPITPIVLTSRMVRANLDDPEAATKHLDTLDRNIARLRTLLHDLLDAARMQSHRIDIHPRTIDLCEAGHDIVEAYRATAQHRNIDLILEAPTGTVPAHADPARINQVAGNLVDNAIKYSDPGDRVTVDVRENNKHSVLEVRDTGRGMSAEQIERLFQPFERVHQRGEGEPPGTGLGLYIAKGIIEQHGGTIEVESAGPGHGTTFRLRLPKQAPVPPTTAPMNTA